MRHRLTRLINRKPIADWLNNKFAKKPEIAKSNIAALNAGHAFGETAEMSLGIKRYDIGPAKTQQKQEQVGIEAEESEQLFEGDGRLPAVRRCRGIEIDHRVLTSGCERITP